MECWAEHSSCAQDSTIPLFQYSIPPVRDRRRGVALLLVLLIVAAITILATGFLAGADTELACGANTLVRVQMDQLAQSGLDHARGLVLHPQDVPANFWTTGATAQQLVAASRDYYDVRVTPDTARYLDYCTYTITSQAYHQRADGQRTGRSSLAATLRLDPCIALQVGGLSTFWNGLNVYGDVYAKNGLVNNGWIDGDVFTTSLAGTGTRTGQWNPQPPTLAWPPVTAAYANWDYPVPRTVIGALVAGTYQPAAVWQCAGNLDITGNARVSGMLRVGGNLTFRDSSSGSQIIAPKNLPALYVGGSLEIESAAAIQIEGLVVVEHNVRITGTASNVTILGGLFVGGTVDPNGLGATVKIVSDPMKASIVATNSGLPQPWSPAAGAFYRNIRRQ